MASRSGHSTRYARNRRKFIYKRDNYTCHYCETKFIRNVPDYEQNYITHGNHLTLDHIVPKSLGGPDSRENLVAACYECNHARGDIGYKAFKRLIARKLASESTIFDYTTLTAAERAERERTRKARCELKFSH